MKTIKIALPFLAFMLLGSASFAQTTFGIRAGVNFSNINGRDDNDDKLDYKITPGFNVGVNAEIPVAEDFYFQPGLLFSAKGAKVPEEGFGEEAKIHLGYIEMPLNFLYKPALGKGKLLLGFGPYIAYGVTGKVKSTESDNEADIVFKKLPDNPDGDKLYLKPFDAGANVLFGYEFANRLSAQLNAQLGLANFNAYDTDAKLMNTVFGISLGYRFGK